MAVTRSCRDEPGTVLDVMGRKGFVVVKFMCQPDQATECPDAGQILLTVLWGRFRMRLTCELVD